MIKYSGACDQSVSRASWTSVATECSCERVCEQEAKLLPTVLPHNRLSSMQNAGHSFWYQSIFSRPY